MNTTLSNPHDPEPSNQEPAGLGPKRIREAGENESLVFGGLFIIYWISTVCAPPGAPPAPATRAETLEASFFFFLFFCFNDQKYKK